MLDRESEQQRKKCCGHSFARQLRAGDGGKEQGAGLCLLRGLGLNSPRCMSEGMRLKKGECCRLDLDQHSIQ